MSSTLTVTDQIVPALLKLQKSGRGMGLEAMNKGGAKTRPAIISDTKSAGFHNIDQRFQNGTRLLRAGKKRYFSRYDKVTGAEQTHLGEFSKWKLHPMSGVLLIGFFDTKRFKTYYYKGGVLQKTGTVQGAVTKSIVDKIINGRTDNNPTLKQKKLFTGSGFYEPKRFKYKANPSILKWGKYVSILNKEIDKAFNQAFDEAKIA